MKAPIMTANKVLQLRNFRFLWLGQAISQLGDAFYVLAFAYMVREITGSAAYVAYVGIAEGLPFLIMSPYAGVIVERFDRRRIMLAADLLSVGALASLSLYILFYSMPPLWMVFATAFFLSTVNSFFAPAKSAVIPELVPKPSLLDALSLSASTQNMAPLIGIGVFSAVIGALSGLSQDMFFFGAIFANALTFLGSAICIAKLPKLVPNTIKKVKIGAWEDCKEGVRYILKSDILKISLVLTLLLNLFIAPFMMVYVEANAQWLDGRPATLAKIELAYSVALAIGSIVVSKYKAKKPGAIFISGLLMIGIVIVLMAYSQQFWPFMACNMVFGFAFPLVTVPLNNYVQMIIHEGYRGRVNSALNMLSQGIMPIGMGIAGFAIGGTGLPLMFIMMGSGMCLSALIGLSNKAFRNCKMPEYKGNSSLETAS